MTEQLTRAQRDVDNAAKKEIEDAKQATRIQMAKQKLNSIATAEQQLRLAEINYEKQKIDYQTWLETL